MVHLLSTLMSPLNLLITALLLFVLNRIYFELTIGVRRRRLIAENGCKPPPHFPHKGLLGKLFGWDIVKDVMKSGREGRMHEASRIRNYSRGNHTMEFRRIDQQTIVTIEPENVKAVLATKFQDFVLGKQRSEIFIKLFGHGIFDTDGAAWEHSRALIRPNFVRTQVADLDMFESHMQHLIENVPRDGSTVDLQDLFFGLTMDSATEFLFGRSTNTLAPGLETKSANQFVKAFIYCTERISYEFRTFGLLKYVPNAEWRRNVQTVHSFADEVVSQALDEMANAKLAEDLASGKKKYTFLYELISRTKDRYTLRSELLNVLLAGRDTTAGLLSNTWHVLSKRPDIVAKLRAEVDALNGERPDYQALKDLKYLKYVLNESLRLMPVVPGNTRQAIRDTVLPLGGGPDEKSPILIKKGQYVAYHVWSMHRRTDFYGDDALEFRPERWESLRPGWYVCSYSPFLSFMFFAPQFDLTSFFPTLF
jgi:cytochrome P450